MVFRSVQPRYPVRQLRQEIDRLFNGMLNTAGEVGWPWPVRGRPALNVWETKEAVLVETELPGVKPEQLDVSVIGDELSLKVERSDVEQEGVTYHRRERPVGSFARVVRLPVPVDAGRVEADLRNGVLTITLPKAESARPRKIQVSSAG